MLMIHAKACENGFNIIITVFLYISLHLIYVGILQTKFNFVTFYKYLHMFCASVQDAFKINWRAIIQKNFH